MRKIVIASFTALALASSSAVFAEPSEADGPPPWHDAMKPSAEDLKAFTDARIAALKTGLRLTPEQEKVWPALDDALRNAASAREARMEAWRERRKDRKEQAKDERPTPIERLKARADRMTERAGEMRKLADAAEPFYKTLNTDQQRRFGPLFREAVGHPGGPRGGFGPGCGPHMRHGGPAE